MSYTKKVLLNRVTFVRSSGNNTAFVWDHVARENQGCVSKKIQKQFRNIEQVMFIEQDKGLIYGQMAGGEFCGNATRSLGYLLMKGRNGSITLDVSGASKPQNVSVNGQFSRTSIPIINNFECVKADEDNFIVEMEGIAFLISTKDDPHDDSQVMEMLNNKNLCDLYPASGIIFLTKVRDDKYAMHPHVFVRDTGTLYYETACGSGTTAVGLLLSKQSGKSLGDIEICQPSGMSIFVSVERTEKEFLYAYIDGPIEILSEQSIIVSL